MGALCQVIRHHPICTCPLGYEGDPFTQCTKIPVTIAPPPKPTNPCEPSPCGPYSRCKPLGSTPMCSCSPGYRGAPPNCRPECITNDECSRKLACAKQKCIDPCDGACGLNADCSVRNHLPVCKCPSGYEGDPFRQCNKIPEVITNPEIIDPCFPSPCGSNTDCNTINRRASCKCMKGYFGDPYTGCRPECVSNSDCQANRACSNLKCIDPCPGTCGVKARCQVVNHIPTCTCSQGYRGDPFTQCILIPSTGKESNVSNYLLTSFFPSYSLLHICNILLHMHTYYHDIQNSDNCMLGKTFSKCLFFNIFLLHYLHFDECTNCLKRIIFSCSSHS